LFGGVSTEGRHSGADDGANGEQWKRHAGGAGDRTEGVDNGGRHYQISD